MKLKDKLKVFTHSPLQMIHPSSFIRFSLPFSFSSSSHLFSSQVWKKYAEKNRSAYNARREQIRRVEAENAGIIRRNEQKEQEMQETYLRMVEKYKTEERLYNQQMEQYNTRFSECNKRIAELNKEKQSAEVRCQELGNAVEVIKKKCTGLKAEQAQLMEKIKQLQSECKVSDSHP